MKTGWWIAGLGALVVAAGAGYLGRHAPVTDSVRAASAGQAASPVPQSPSDSAPATSTASTGNATTAAAPPFQVASLNAGPVKVPNGQPTVVYFMSAGCGSCISGEQQLAHVAAITSASVQWLSLDVDPGYDTPKAVLSMAHYTGAHWPQAFGTNAIINAYHVTQLDMVAVIAKNGKLLYDGALPSNTQLQTLIAQANA